MTPDLSQKPSFLRPNATKNQEADVPTASPPKTTKTTWVDLLGPDEPEPAELFTRDEIADMATGIDPVTGDDIRYWEYQGVLPRSVRRRYKGATRAVYPAWYADLARGVRLLQRHGLSLDTIRQRGMKRTPPPLAAGSGSLPTALVSALNAFARDHAEEAGSPVAHIELSIFHEDGNGSVFGIPIRDSDTK